jgi:hypothetical protein
MGSGERKQANAALSQQGNIAGLQTDLSRQLIGESAPWRAIAGKYYTGIAKGGDELTKAVAPQINATTVQFQNALKSAKEMPVGGSRDRALRGIRMGEAATKSNIYSGGVNDAIAKLGTMGMTGTGEGMGGFSSAGSGYANIAKSYSDMAQGKAGEAGGLAGAGGGIAAAAIAA